jgi:hypothetical protein
MNLAIRSPISAALAHLGSAHHAPQIVGRVRDRPEV